MSKLKLSACATGSRRHPYASFAVSALAWLVLLSVPTAVVLAQEASSFPQAASADQAAELSQPDAVGAPVEATQPDIPLEADVADFLAAQEETSPIATLLPDSLRLYGFADFTYGKVFGNSLSNAFRPFSSFYVGNLNVYVDARLADDWRSLMEVRFTYLPHGSFDGEGNLITVEAQDYADNLGGITVGGIEIERAWAEYTPFRWFGIRAGQWLTPYGIWNVDHGTPTLLAIQKPYLVSSAVFPERQTGIMLHGSFPLSDANDLRYHATISNGRGSFDAYRDLDSNKAVGGRLVLEHRGAARAQLGISGYLGRYTESQFDITLGGVLPDVALRPTVRYDEAAMAIDLRATWLGFDIVAEAILGEVVYADGKRPNALRGFSSQAQADLLRGGAYTIVGYTITLLRLMPFAGYDYIDDPLQIGRAHFLRAGLRFMPIASVTLKGEFLHLFPGTETFAIRSYDSLRFQLAWAFQ